RSHLVQQSIVARRFMRRFFGQLRMRKETKRAQPIVRIHDDDALLCQHFAVVTWFRSAACDESSAVVPHKNRQLRTRGLCRNPYIQVQAVFARLRIAEINVAEYVGLQASRSELVGGADSCPL